MGIFAYMYPDEFSNDRRGSGYREVSSLSEGWTFPFLSASLSTSHCILPPACGRFDRAKHSCQRSWDYYWASLTAEMVKNLPAVQETRVHFLDWEDPLRRFPWKYWLPTPVFYGQRSLVGYSPWSHKEPDTTEWLTLYDWLNYVSEQFSPFEPWFLMWKRESLRVFEKIT